MLKKILHSATEQLEYLRILEKYRKFYNGDYGFTSLILLKHNVLYSKLLFNCKELLESEIVNQLHGVRKSNSNTSKLGLISYSFSRSIQFADNFNLPNERNFNVRSTQSNAQLGQDKKKMGKLQGIPLRRSAVEASSNLSRRTLQGSIEKS